MVAAGMVFDPSDKEIVSYYLPKLIAGEAIGEWQYLISFSPVYSTKPSLLFDINNGKNLPFIKSNQRFFFSHRERISQNNENGKRPRRVVEGHQEWQSYQGDENSSGGYWKSSTGEKPIYNERQEDIVLGYVNVLNFFEFKNKNKSRKEATKTSWLMHEYRLPGEKFQEWVICKIKDTSRPGHDEYEHIWLDQLFGTILFPPSNQDRHHTKQLECQSQATLQEREEALVFLNETCLPSDLQVDLLMDTNVDGSSFLHQPESGQIVCGLGQQEPNAMTIHDMEQIMTKDDDEEDPFKEVEQLLGIGNSFLNETSLTSDLQVNPIKDINIVDGSSCLLQERPADESGQLVCGLGQQDPSAMANSDVQQINIKEDDDDPFKEMEQMLGISDGFLNETSRLASDLQVDSLTDINIVDGSSCLLQEPAESGKLVYGSGQQEPSAMANNDVKQIKTNKDDDDELSTEMELLLGMNESEDDEISRLVELISADIDADDLLHMLDF
ncbi:hypothetical protein DITRI_Ditri17bG0097700 [Diplodiscus trichospermus]